jgi:hypothetical protein
LRAHAQRNAAGRIWASITWLATAREAMASRFPRSFYPKPSRRCAAFAKGAPGEWCDYGGTASAPTRNKTCVPNNATCFAETTCFGGALRRAAAAVPCFQLGQPTNINQPPRNGHTELETCKPSWQSPSNEILL